MGQVFLTGDTHGDIRKITNFIQRMKLNSEDAIIICGDAGFLWREDLEDLKITLEYWEKYSNGVNLYFLDGNHENFNLLSQLPIDGNNMLIISDTIHYLRRGHIYTFNNKKVLVCGGADSIDRARRREGITWWAEEAITQSNIDRVPASHYDYVLTHCCPRSIFEDNRVFLMTLSNINENNVIHTSEDMLEQLKNKITFDNWVFGHYHVDRRLDDRFICLFNDFIEL